MNHLDMDDQLADDSLEECFDHNSCLCNTQLTKGNINNSSAGHRYILYTQKCRQIFFLFFTASEIHWYTLLHSRAADEFLMFSNPH